MSESIFSPAIRMRWPSAQNPRGYSAPFTSSPAPARGAAVPAAPSPDRELIAIIEAPLQPGETAYVGYARKEAELRTVFAALSVLESRALHARLSNPRSGDQLAAAFFRLTPDRRARLIKFLADARRREALKRL